MSDPGVLCLSCLLSLSLTSPSLRAMSSLDIWGCLSTGAGHARAPSSLLFHLIFMSSSTQGKKSGHVLIRGVEGWADTRETGE